MSDKSQTTDKSLNAVPTVGTNGSGGDRPALGSNNANQGAEQNKTGSDQQPQKDNQQPQQHPPQKDAQPLAQNVKQQSGAYIDSNFNYKYTHPDGTVETRSPSEGYENPHYTFPEVNATPTEANKSGSDKSQPSDTTVNVNSLPDAKDSPGDRPGLGSGKNDRTLKRNNTAANSDKSQPKQTENKPLNSADERPSLKNDIKSKAPDNQQQSQSPKESSPQKGNQQQSQKDNQQSPKNNQQRPEKDNSQASAANLTQKDTSQQIPKSDSASNHSKENVSLSEKVFDAADKFFNPNVKEHPGAAAVMKNMSERGKSIFESQTKEVKERGKVVENLLKGNLNEAGRIRANSEVNHVQEIVKAPIGFAKLVAHTGEAAGDLVYGLTHSNEAGSDVKIANSVTDLVLDAPNIVLAVDGAVQGIKAVGSVAGVGRGIESGKSAAPTLIGRSEAQMRRDAAKLIRETPDHKLKFLLDENGNLKGGTRGMKHSELIDRPDLVQMGHVESKQVGAPDRIVLQDAWINQRNGTYIEHPRNKGAFVETNAAIDIDGVGVCLETAQMWESLNLIPKGTVASAKRIY